jgi:hypothetical protein
VRAPLVLDDEKKDQEYEEEHEQEEDNEDTRTKICAAPKPMSAAVLLMHAMPPESAKSTTLIGGERSLHVRGGKRKACL